MHDVGCFIACFMCALFLYRCCFFHNRDYLSEYSSSLADQGSPPLSAKVRCNASYTRLLFQKIEQHLSADSTNKLFIGFIPHLLAAFIAQNRLVKLESSFFSLVP